ncbi:hypothetical protein BZA70DRAFT_273188 [Myxozyma melibiosi]|uniref:C2H2-type domain-containing protein n=1 Tax=Myxozyma melibiosi TaxID=54550 RepID=A0ABR1FED8_9ASCO
MTASTLPPPPLPSSSSSSSQPPHKPLHERFRCSVCNASYARSGHLRRHEVTHSGEKNFVCEFCGRRFFRVYVSSSSSLYSSSLC